VRKRFVILRASQKEFLKYQFCKEGKSSQIKISEFLKGAKNKESGKCMSKSEPALTVLGNELKK